MFDKFSQFLKTWVGVVVVVIVAVTSAMVLTGWLKKHHTSSALVAMAPSMLLLAAGISVFLFLGNKFNEKVAEKVVGAPGSDMMDIAHNDTLEVDPAHQKQLDNLVEGVSIACGVKPPIVKIVPSQAPDACSEDGPGTGIIYLTTALLAGLTRAELEGVIAHELGHIANKDHTRLHNVEPYDKNNTVYGVRSSMEVAADAFAVNVTKNPAGLRSALEKMFNNPTHHPGAQLDLYALWIRPEDSYGPGLVEIRIQNLRAAEKLDPNVIGAPTTTGTYVPPPPWSPPGGTGAQTTRDEHTKPAENLSQWHDGAPAPEHPLLKDDLWDRD